MVCSGHGFVDELDLVESDPSQRLTKPHLRAFVRLRLLIMRRGRPRSAAGDEVDRAADHDALPQGSDHSARFVEHAGQKCGDEIDQRVELPADPGFGERPAREEALDGLDQPPFAEMLDVPLHGVRTSGDRGAVSACPHRSVEFVVFETEKVEDRTENVSARERDAPYGAVLGCDGQGRIGGTKVESDVAGHAAPP